MKELIELRQHLHKYPELSGNEFATSRYLQKFINKFLPSYIVKLGETGFAFIYDSQVPGKTTMIRAELDALPINEDNNIAHISLNKGVAHLCGHDGHMTIVAGLAKHLSENPPKKGKVVLLFQPAEETGEGANKIIHDNKFKKIAPDYIFALHNIPGVELGKVLFKEGTFASASKGMTIKLFGKTSHAAEPEKGINPTDAIAAIIQKTNSIKTDLTAHFKQKILLTIINIRLGDIAFGTSPGYAEVRITLRAFNNQDLHSLTQMLEIHINELATSEKLKAQISYSEEFPATQNSQFCNSLIIKAAHNEGLEFEELTSPFNWSEDFGYYTQNIAGGFFGLGSGLNQPVLHNPGYDFPDALIEKGIGLFKGIIKNINY